VEHILTVTSAHVHRGITKGIFVKTSYSQADRDFADRSLEGKGDPIELDDATRFYEALGLVQIPFYNSQENFLCMQALYG
jgi:hypothetical protein